jgi:low affinity Fe/Cu permease
MRSRVAIFDGLALWASRAAGQAWAFAAAVTLVMIWGLFGPREQFSDTWQLVINTGTTIITFLMVFLIQHSQNRESEAIRLKLDELIRAIAAADNRLLVAEDMDEDELDRLRLTYENLAQSATEKLNRRRGAAMAKQPSRLTEGSSRKLHKTKSQNDPSAKRGAGYAAKVRK